jgi:TolB protein
MRRVTNSAEDKNVPSWTSDGKRILYRSSTGDTTALRAVDREGGTLVTLVALVANGITLSHDGHRIAYTVGPWKHSQVVVASLDAADATAITNDSAGYFGLAWSPDDRRIAATRRDSTGNQQVWVMNADGSQAHALTHIAPEDGRPEWPAWTADGRKIAIQAGSYDRRDSARNTAHIWVVDMATGVATKLAAHTAPQLDETPSWFPDGQHLAFQSNRTGRLQIWFMSADGGAARQITR